MDIEFIEQLVDSMAQAIERLEWAVETRKEEEINKMKIFIFDLHKKTKEALMQR